MAPSATPSHHLLYHPRHQEVVDRDAPSAWQQNLKKILITLGCTLIVIGPMLLIIAMAIFFTFYRMGVAYVIRRRTGKPVRFMKGMDAVIALESNGSPAIINAILVLQGKPDVYKVRSFIYHNLVKAELSNGKLLYPTLQQYIHEEYGYYIWRDEEKFSIEQHVEMHRCDPVKNRDAFHYLIGQLSNQPFPARTSGWCFVLVPLAQGFEDLDPAHPHYALVMRVHHGLADGISLVRMILSNMVDNAEQIQAKVFPSQKRLDHMSNLKKVLRILANTPQALYKQVMRNDNNVLHGRPLSGQKLVGFSRPLDLNMVKRVKSVTGATVNDVLMSCLTASLRQHFLDSGRPVPENVTAIVPVSMHRFGGPIQLGNQCTFVGYDIPVNVSSPMQRLAVSRMNMDQLKESPDMWFNLYGFNLLMNTIPNYMTRPYFDYQRITCIVSNVPGAQQSHTLLGGYQLKRTAFLLPHRGKIGLGMSILTYNNEVQVGVIVDSALVESQNDVDKMLDNFAKELHTLNETAKQICI